MYGYSDTLMDLRHPAALGGQLLCQLAPQVGGAIASFALIKDGARTDLLRPSDPRAVRGGWVTDLSCFPLIPFSNRLRDGRFSYDGRDVVLPRNATYTPHAIHGHGWQVPWMASNQTATSVDLTYLHEADSWPWRYEAKQQLQLDANGLSITLTLTNLDTAAMPAGFGLHPYFPRPTGTRLLAPVKGRWMVDDSMLPVARIKMPASLDFSRSVDIDGMAIDQGFFGWSGYARLEWPTRRMALSVVTDPPLGHVILYASQDGDWFCVEPVSHMTNAFHHMDEPDHGLRHLVPGASERVHIRFRPEPI